MSKYLMQLMEEANKAIKEIEEISKENKQIKNSKKCIGTTDYIIQSKNEEEVVNQGYNAKEKLEKLHKKYESIMEEINKKIKEIDDSIETMESI